MELEHLVRLCRSFEEEGLAFWIDGGWGVDALLGKQTRPHSDLDLAVKHGDLLIFRRVLQTQAYSRVYRAGNTDWNWVFQDPAGRSIDLHGFVPDGQGNGVLGDPVEGAMYPAGALDGIGMLGGIEMRCVAAPFVLKFRNGFEPRPVDHHDVAVLCARFGLVRPSRFQRDDR
jgi:lincosamide nucleotidyltransferase A/C/D/E